MSTTLFMGQEVDSKNGVHTITKAGVNNIMTEAGVTKEVRKAVTDVEQSIAIAAIEFLKGKVIENKSEQKLLCGAGNDKYSFALKGMSTVTIPSQDKNVAPAQKTVFGQFSMRQSKVLPKAIKEGQVLTDAKAAIEAALGK